MNESLIRAYTEFVFVSDAPRPADILFIPGNRSSEPSTYAAKLWHEGFAPLILPSGKWSVSLPCFSPPDDFKKRFPHTEPKTEWAYMRAILMQRGVPSSVILKEDTASFTWQNAIASRRVTDEFHISVRTAIVCCLPAHARRCKLYYSSVYPDADILICPPPGCAVTRDTWFTTPEGIDTVLDEVERCGSQFHYILKESLLDESFVFPSKLQQQYMPERNECSVVSPD